MAGNKKEEIAVEKLGVCPQCFYGQQCRVIMTPHNQPKTGQDSVAVIRVQDGLVGLTAFPRVDGAHLDL
jgi:hypothetical protein